MDINMLYEMGEKVTKLVPEQQHCSLSKKTNFDGMLAATISW